MTMFLSCRIAITSTRTCCNIMRGGAGATTTTTTTASLNFFRWTVIIGNKMAMNDQEGLLTMMERGELRWISKYIVGLHHLHFK